MPSRSRAQAVAGLPPGSDEALVFRALFLSYPDALLLVDHNGTIVLANPEAAKLLGYTLDELRGLHVEALVPDGIRPRHAEYRAEYGRSPRARAMGTQMDLVARRKDGSEVMVEIALSPLKDHGLPFVVAAIRGIGAYPRVKQALQRARYAEHLAQVGRFAVDTRDPQELLGHVPAIAAEALQLEAAMVFLLESDQIAMRVAGGVGAVAGEQVGSRIPYRPDSPPGLVLSQGVPLVVEDYRSEQRFVVPRAYLDAGWVSSLAVPISDRGRTIGVLSVHSRSARLFGEDELRFLGSLASLLTTSLQRSHSEEALNHAQRLESVGQLTGGIAHDFNNLLTVIQGNLQVLEELPALHGDGYAQQLVGAAARATRRGAELTSKLLAFSRRQVLQPAPVDVGSLVQSLAGMLRRTLDQRIVIEVDIVPDCPPVLADPGQLEAALLNIAINARDAMPDGGTLSFRCGHHPPSSAASHPEDDPRQRGGQLLAIAISDTGIGMPDEVKERVFEPFFTTKEAGRGTGLGLSTVYGFVQQSNGTITIASAPQRGTTVTLYLPQPGPDQAPLTDKEDAPAVVPAGLRVLLVEDDAEVHAVVRTFLDALGCEVLAATSGEHALSMLEATPQVARPQLLLSDIALGPGMRGTQLAAMVQERLPAVAVLLMSGFSQDLLDANQSSPPSWELLPKPFSRAELARAIASVLSGRMGAG